MTREGRLARGKEHYEKNRFLDNPETLEYLETLPKKEKKKDDKSDK